MWLFHGKLPSIHQRKRVVHIGIGNRLSDGILIIVRVDGRVGVDRKGEHDNN